MELHLERGRIRAVMPNAVGVVIRTETRTYEFPGCVVLPGFVDNHAHILGLGSRLASVSLHDAASIAECRARLQQAVIPDTGWLQAMGWNQELWTDGRMPSAADLDDLFPTTPVVASRVDGHAMWVNSEALRRAGITNSNGLLVEDERDPVWTSIPEPTEQDIRSRIAAAAQACVQQGVTEVHDMDVAPRVVAVMREMAETGALPIRLQSFVSAQHDEWIEAGLLPAGGEIQRTAGVKLYADGALGSRTAALLNDYTDDTGNTGMATLTVDQITRAVRAAIDAGWWCVAIHAIGDAAVRTVLDAYAIVRSWDDGSEILLRIEHAQHVHPDDVHRFAELSVAACVQPTQWVSDSKMALLRVGAERQSWAYRWRSLLESGALVGAGSDFPIEEVDPIAGIAAFVNRPSSEAITIDQALDAFTSQAHRTADMNYRRGQLDVGYDADLVILDRDPRTTPAAELANIRVMATFMAGQLRYTA
jgi:predicted amidohydrolase YtcJ